ncbi:MAG: ABC transporter permease [Desulfobacteraceae bacterium]|nr:MAG: ABC transporter permease [Desulfobacteraceae bacterium]
MLRLEVKRRQTPLSRGGFLLFPAAIFLSLSAGALLLSLQGKPGVGGMVLLFKGAFGSGWALEDSLVKAIPIFLCSLGVAVAFRLQVWNIGAEGQFALGAVGAAAMALAFPNLHQGVLLPAMMISAMLAGGAWGLIPALLKIRLRTNEIIVTLMLNYIGILFLDYLVYGPWKDPVSFGFPMTREFPPAGVIGAIGATRINWGVFLCLFFAAAFWIFFRFSRLGYELRAGGENPRAARYAGFPIDGLVILVMTAGGALAACAGFIEASANLNRLQPSIMVGYGYTAIVVAWLAQLNPFYIGLASYLLAGLRVGVELIQLDLQVPAAFGGILEGLVLLVVLIAGFFIRYRVRMRRRL